MCVKYMDFRSLIRIETENLTVVIRGNQMWNDISEKFTSLIYARIAHKLETDSRLKTSSMVSMLDFIFRSKRISFSKLRMTSEV